MSLSSIGEYTQGQKIAEKYTLLSEIGSGGMGSVWLARNETTEADVALKIWRAMDDDADQTKARFRNEARMSAMLTHRNIVRVFDLVTDPNGALVLVMERLRGCTLASYLRAFGKAPPRAAIAIAVGILGALEQAHIAGIVHRDVKPANVFLAVDPDGHVTPKLLDFGIAKVPAANTSLTEDGRSLGTPRYMSPEQIRGKEIDGRSDIFSMSVILYEMLTGISPFNAETPAGSLAAVLEVAVDPDPNIDAQLFTELSRGLAKRPYERPATASEFAASLRRAGACTDAELDDALRQLEPYRIADEPPRPMGTGPRLEGSARRGRPLWPFAIGAVAIAILAFIGVRAALHTDTPVATSPLASARANASAQTTAAAPSSAPTTAGATTASAQTAQASWNDVPDTPTPSQAGGPSADDPSSATGRRPIKKTGKKPVAVTPGF